MSKVERCAGRTCVQPVPLDVTIPTTAGILLRTGFSSSRAGCPGTCRAATTLFLSGTGARNWPESLVLRTIGGHNRSAGRGGPPCPGGALGARRACGESSHRAGQAPGGGELAWSRPRRAHVSVWPDRSARL